MNFLEAAVQEVHGPKTSVIQMLKDRLDVSTPPRSFDVTHASDLTKKHFCPREVALFDITKVERKNVWHGMAMNVTFDVGEMTNDLVREKWLKEKIWGDWECRRCKTQLHYCTDPVKTEETSIKYGCKHDWKYKEIQLAHPLGFTGSLDGLVDLGQERLTILEIKSMSPDEWEKLQAPLAEHRVRTSLYMKLVEDSGANEMLKPQINVESARILYVSKAHGRKNPEFNNTVMPFKEFEILREDDNPAIKLAMERAAQMQEWRKAQKMPPKVCAVSFQPEAKQCQMCPQCFSGKFP